MPTPSEQKALAFVAILILLGGAVRVLRAGPSTPTGLEQQALARQATAADSASGKPKKGKRPSRTAATPHVVGGVASVAPSYARPDQPFSTSPYGYPPPGPRLDTDVRGIKPAAAAPSTAGKGAATGLIDLDVATEKEIEALPRVGPALAQRIVANRDSLGPFRSLEGFRRVKGVGAATIKLFEPLVTFSGKPGPRARPQ
ncbi:MAG: Helix-hairpin-helix DNA-binding class 1 [Gemmatimonadetes bacterium]|nr:Helix-hairpin-helix DNA-binding class 1 [Gemmatimonadota bacterium]